MTDRSKLCVLSFLTLLIATYAVYHVAMNETLTFGKFKHNMNLMAGAGFLFGDKKTKPVTPLSGKYAPSQEDAKLGYCQKRRFVTGLPVTGLLSIPGSGNTWTRYLMEQVTGVYTASLYCNKVLKRKFFGECYGNSPKGRNKTLGVKYHLAKQSKIFDRIILVIRNPLRAIAAELQRQTSGSQVGVSQLNHIRGTTIKGMLKQWLHFHRYWLAFQRPLLIIFYDDLKLNLRSQLIRLCQFLEVKCSENLLDCVLAHSEGDFHRPKHNDTSIFDTKHLQLAKVYQDEIMAKIRQLSQNIRNDLVF